MAVVPLRKTVIEDDPKPDTGRVAIHIDDDGSTEIEIGGDQTPQEEVGPDTDFERNLAETMDAQALSSLAQYLIEGIDSDDQGRQEWTATVDQVSAYLGINLEDPASSVAADGTVCQAVATCLLEASVKLWSTGYAEQCPVGGPVKVQRRDPIPVGSGETPNADPSNPSAATGAPGLPGLPNGGAGIGAGGNGVGNPALAGAAAGAANGARPDVGGLGSAAGMGGGGTPGLETGLSPPPPGLSGAGTPMAAQATDTLADALESDLNWYLTVGDKAYYPDHSQMLMNRNLIGVAFKEIYRCPIVRKPISRWVMGQDFIVQGNPAHLDATSGRVTVRKKISQAIMRRLMVSGEYRDIPLVAPTHRTSQTEIVIGQSQGIAPPSLPRDFEHEVYECICELGSGTNHDLYGVLKQLDHDETGKDPGYPLPYRVAIDVDSREILSIRRWWKKGDEYHQRRKRFVKYGMIPSFGFYDWGLIHLVGNPTQGATMLMRSGIDAALFSNFPAWAQKQGPTSRLENTVYRPSVGEVVKIATSGDDIRKEIMPWPYKEPNAQSLALQGKLESDVKRLAGLVELPVGEGRIGNTPVGTIMSYIESVTMVPGAVHKLDHMAQAEEFELLRDLIAEDPSVLVRGNKSPARKWQIASELLSPDLAPKADPNTPSQQHRLLKIQGMIMLGGLPQFEQDGIPNQRAIYRKAVQVLMGEDASEYENPPPPPNAAPPPPDPKVVAATIKAQSEDKKDQSKQQEIALDHAGKIAELKQESADKAADREAENERARLKVYGERQKTGAGIVSDAIGHLHDGEQADAQRAHDQGMQSREHAQQLTAPLLAPEKPTDGE